MELLEYLLTVCWLRILIWLFGIIAGLLDFASSNTKVNLIRTISIALGNNASVHINNVVFYTHQVIALRIYAIFLG